MFLDAMPQSAKRPTRTSRCNAELGRGDVYAVLARPFQPLRFSPVPGIFLRNDPIRNEPPVLPCIKSLESGKTTAEMQREPGLTHVITLASNENPSGASPCTLACPAGTCVSSVSVVPPFRCGRKQYNKEP